ncbi:hypothetical protein LWI28_014077 [Acer negundo]|uniref:Uncharacterized protein n=1 Tax=Acer negundo TaxID=4023 RepID=A0AAD5JA86_ACENE|nr:hypothetical protein LWI28_014077 [Acer negundo]
MAWKRLMSSRLRMSRLMCRKVRSRLRMSRRLKMSRLMRSKQVGDDQVDAQQDVDNQNDEEEGVIRHSQRIKRIKKLAAVVQTPYTVPRLVKDMVYVRKNSRRC